MELTLLSTKLYIPAPRPALVDRPRLLARLNDGMHPGGKLILVCAPAGFGKTSLLADWLRQSEALGMVNTAWVSLDLADNDPARFWSYVLTAIERVLPGVARPPLQALQTPQPPPIETLLTLVINRLAEAAPRQGPIVLALDDYHVISAPAIHAALTFLLDQLPPQVYLILISRADPSLPLARWRARNQLTEIRAVDLRFTVDEAARFFHGAMRLALAEPEVAALAARTEGWAAGLHLAALALQDRADRSGFVASFAGSNRFVVDYLVEEVVARQPAHLQTFLLQTAILERMCGPLCDAVLGLDAQGGHGAADGERALELAGNARLPPSLEAESYSQLILHELERANLFTLPLDDERHWYRYHQLFAEVLRERLRASVPAAAVAELHLRASAWFEQYGFAVEAIAHALAAGSWERAAALVEAWAWPVVFRGQIHTVLGWFTTLPAERIRARPSLGLLYALMLMHTDQLAAAEARVAETEAGLPPDMAEAQARQVRGLALTTRANISFYRGALAGCVAFGRQALARLPETPSLERAAALAFAAHGFLLSGEATAAIERQVAAVVPAARAVDNRFVLLRGFTLLAQLQILQGRLRAAAASYREAALVAPEPDGVQYLIGGAGYAFGLGDLYREWNDLAAAERHLRAGMERLAGGLTANATYLTQGAIALARLQHAAGEPAGA
ncbi:MAG: hypothetical protein HGA45_21330, partial [Chloroflexales bacterium]|nr:hypothetical protein [Chloroflexales bacterium]